MEVVELRTHAKEEVLEIGPMPSEPREHEIWVAERRCSMALLADLADHDRDLLRRAATGDWVTTEVRDLPLAAANEFWRAVASSERIPNSSGPVRRRVTVHRCRSGDMRRSQTCVADRRCRARWLSNWLSTSRVGSDVR